MSNELTRITIAIDGSGSEAWEVTDVHAIERLFAPTRVTVGARATEIVEPDDLIGLDVSLEIAFGEDVHAFHGVVLEASELAWREDGYELQVVFASKLALLQLGRDHRIYQEMTVEEVVKDVLARAGIDGLTEWRLDGSYEPHANIVQYAESDYDFVTRLLFEEGIGFSVEQDEAAEKIVFFDSDAVFQAIEGESVLSHVRGAQGRTGVTRLYDVHRVSSDQVMLNDYDLTRPGADLRMEAATEDTTAREVYLHPGGYTDPGRGQRLTDRWLERLRMQTRAFVGTTNVVQLTAGRFFSAGGAPREAIDADILLVEVVHRVVSDRGEDGASATTGGVTSKYENRFEAIPLDVPYRPPHAAPPPVIAGVQHALVTVPGGEEIHNDDYGRAKVRFLWDRSGITDDKSSTWLRVGQLALGGSMIHPRVDFEVLVDFELGDVDRPAISGHLYNQELPPPYALPDGATISSMQTATTEGGPGANELRYEDAAGSEEIFVNASRDLIASVDHDTTWNVGNDQSRAVGSNETLSVTADCSTSVAGNRSLEVGANQSVNVGGEYGDGTGGGLSVTIGANRMVQVGGDHSENVNGSLSRTVGSLQCLTGIAGYARTVVGDSTTNVGAAWAELAGGARGLSIAGSYTETIGALKLIKAKNVSVACDAAYVMNAAAEVVKAGGGRTDDAKGAIALTAGAALKVKAKNIIFEAKSKLVFRGGGGVIELTKAGMVKIKAPSITIENAKALNQIMHKSN